MGVPTITSIALITTTATEKKLFQSSDVLFTSCAEWGYLIFQQIRAKSDMHEMVEKMTKTVSTCQTNERKPLYLSVCANWGFRDCAAPPLLRSFLSL